jgi:probable O-glycosylation ligase (exosortase A-associated)
MRDLLVALIVFGSVPFTFVRPYIGILVWTWLSLMNPHRLTWGFAYQLRVAMVVGAVTLCAWLFSREPKRPPLAAPTVILALFMIWLSIATFFAVNPVDAMEKWSQVIKILGMTFVAMCLLQDRHRIQLMAWAIAVSIGFYGVRGGIFTILTGGNYRVYGPPGTFIQDNNQLGLAMIMVLPFIWYLFMTTTQRFLRLGLLGAGALTVVAIAGTHSRGAFVALSVLMSYMWFKSRYKVVTLVGALVLGAGVLTMLPSHWYDRMSTIQTYDQDESVRGRFDAWTFAWRVAKEKPLLGGGFSVFYDGRYFMQLVPEAIAPRAAHSIYFEVLGETGFVGLGMFLALGVSTFFTAMGVGRLARDHPDLEWAKLLASMMQVSLTGYAVAGAFLNLGFFDLYYFIIALTVALKVVVTREIAAKAPVPSGPPRYSQAKARPPAPALAQSG